MKKYSDISGSNTNMYRLKYKFHVVRDHGETC